VVEKYQVSEFFVLQSAATCGTHDQERLPCSGCHPAGSACTFDLLVKGFLKLTRMCCCLRMKTMAKIPMWKI
jgi:hypothetical protein